MSLRRVAIVGAGIAGLSAARRLAGAGLEVVVFDKARRPGGRVSTRRAGTFAFDHGAQYFTCRDPSFRRLVEEWCAHGVAIRWDARLVQLARGVTEAVGRTDERYVGAPGMSALTRHLAAGRWIERGRRVELLERSVGGWRVVCGDGSVFVGFDAAVTAAPAPQAAALLEPVPDLAQRTASVEMQPCHALMVTFSQPLGVAFDGAFVENSPISWAARNASKPGRGPAECWVLQTTPAWSAAHLDQPVEALEERLLVAFADSLQRELPSRIHQAAHLWRFARSERGLGAPFLWDSEKRMGACGDWCLDGRVEDAFLSGDGLGQALLAESGPPLTAQRA